ncbi:hypothetical protein AGMMS49992_28660 [Clostridia bacterium]|nr:hypothetical protein AGMMS49992_28660 [Clostridia bacterium]
MTDIGVHLTSPGVEIEYIPIDVASIPYSLQIKLTNRTYRFTIKYNEYADFFTLDLETLNDELLAYGDPVRYGRQCFGNIEDERFPMPVIIPYAFGGEIEAITRANFGGDVRLYLLDREAMIAALTREVNSATGGGSILPEPPFVVTPPEGPDEPAPPCGDCAPLHHVHPIDGVIGLREALNALKTRGIPLDQVLDILGGI